MKISLPALEYGEKRYVINEPMISFGDFGTGKFLYERQSREYRNFKFSMSHERHIANPVQVTNFPHSWVSRRGEK